MKRIILILLFALLIIGCGANEPETAVEPTAEQVEVATNDQDAAEEPTEEPEEETAVEEAEEPTAEPVEEPTEEPAEEATAEPVEEETAVESAPVILGDPTQVRESDWVKGAENGRVVIIEYGDFQ